ncbi:hypothetical protein MASR2M41_09110 [Flammeovirgaceae bacterium]
MPINEQKVVFSSFIQELKRYVVIVNPLTALENLHQKQKPLVCLTFDDGYAELANVIAPVLESNGITGLFFVNPDFLGITGEKAHSIIRKSYLTELKKDFLTKNDLIDLSRRGHYIGSHTSSHIRLSNLLDEELLYKEVVLSKDRIEDIISQPCNWFAYPFGTASDINEKSLLLALKTYKYVFSSIKGNDLFSFENRVLNRRHFEGNWDANHLKYFLSGRK